MFIIFKWKIEFTKQKQLLKIVHILLPVSSLNRSILTHLINLIVSMNSTNKELLISMNMISMLLKPIILRIRFLLLIFLLLIMSSSRFHKLNKINKSIKEIMNFIHLFSKVVLQDIRICFLKNKRLKILFYGSKVSFKIFKIVKILQTKSFKTNRLSLHQVSLKCWLK